jgi:hypothetical protein
MLKKILLAVIGLIVIGTIVVLLTFIIEDWLARIAVVGFILATCPKLFAKEPQEQDDFK